MLGGTRGWARFGAVAAVVCGVFAVNLGSAAAAPTGSFTACPPVMKETMTHPWCVAALNQKLNHVNPAHALDPWATTYDWRTRVAVLDFQGTHGLRADGVGGLRPRLA
ncbi:peptidoglycan-binding domain-containing protein, partial [Pseudonocardia pini]|uniref:peptidoglycan-binding domain-containing protein n=1 Tax=Pseudonocardia pini TaxID=2758030 RepID=UPI001C68797E